MEIPFIRTDMILGIFGVSSKCFYDVLLVGYIIKLLTSEHMYL